MPHAERRKSTNAPLRAKIDQIQATHQTLIASMEQVQARTLAWVREQDMADLPNPALAQDLSASFKAQRAALAQMQQATMGAPTALAARQTLITDDEMAALMKP